MEIIDLSMNALILLCLIAVVAGFVDALVGGGGLITIPALLLAGVPPIYVLGTNKLQAVMGSATASAMMLRRGVINLGTVKIMMLAAFIGSAIGTIAIQFFDAQTLTIIIPVVIVLIGIYFVFAPMRSLVAREPRMDRATYTLTAVPTVGFYDGMFGLGTGSFFVLAGVSLRGQEIIDATATAKALNFATNVASLLVFIAFGKLLWTAGAVMMLGQLVGANLGARTLLLVNPKLLKYLLVMICFLMLISWFLSSANG